MDFFATENWRLEALMPLIEERLAAGQSVRFGPRGTSMLPMLRQGIDTVVISPLPGKLKKYDLPLYKRANGQFVLHRIVKSEDTYTCIGDNQFSYEHGVQQEQLIAYVTAFYRGNRRIKTSSPGYRIYCWFWHNSRKIRHFWQIGILKLRRHR